MKAFTARQITNEYYQNIDKINEIYSIIESHAKQWESHVNVMWLKYWNIADILRQQWYTVEFPHKNLRVNQMSQQLMVISR